MESFAQLDGKHKIMIVGGGVLVGYFFLKSVLGHTSTATAPTASTNTSTDPTAGTGNVQTSDPQTAAINDLGNQMGAMMQGFTATIGQQDAQLFQAITQQMNDNQKAQTDALNGLMGKMNTPQAAPTYSPNPAPVSSSHSDIQTSTTPGSPSNPSSWHVNPNGNFSYGSTPVTFTPSAPTVQASNWSIDSHSPSGVYTPSTATNGATFTAGKVTW